MAGRARRRVNVEDLRARGEQLSQELGLESYRAGAGLTAETRFAEILERYADVQGDEAWEAARGVRELEEWVLDARIARAIAPLDDRLHAWESSAEIALDGGERMSYQKARIAEGSEPARSRARSIARRRSRRGSFAIAMPAF